MSDVDVAPSLLEFPCEFRVKLLGRESAELHGRARRLVEYDWGPIAEGGGGSARSRCGGVGG
jgi:hypothetical protein